MLEQKDYKKIKELFDEQGKKLETRIVHQLDKKLNTQKTTLESKIVAQGKELESKITIQGKELKKRLDDKLNKKFNKQTQILEKRIITHVGEMVEQSVLPAIDKLSKKIDRQLDKLYLSDKLADLQSNVSIRQKKKDEKVNLLIKFLKIRKVLTRSQVETLEAFEVFSRTSVVSAD